MEQAIRVDQELNVNTGDSVALKRPLATLIRLFADPALPGGSTKEAQSHSRQFLSPVAERLQFVLWYTRGERLFSHDRVEFTDVDFAREFQDAHYYVNPDGTRYSSNQVNHFLSAVDLGFSSDWLTRDAYKACLIGHEKYRQGSKDEWYQCTIGVTTRELDLFNQAIKADYAGNYADRDCLIEQILPNLPENVFRGNVVLDPR
jgi:hypothetical protein